MTEVIQIEHSRRRGIPQPGGGNRKGPAVFFDRRELDQILQLYSRKVITGEWLDYALGWGELGAEFSIYGRQSNVPLFRIMKCRDKRQGRWRISDRSQVLGQVGTLEAALKLLDRRSVKLVRE
ncbi:MAG: DUF2794 domain-containing protein [Alphaproteobacteria bacterium]